MGYKIPISALVLVHTRELDVLLIERADYPGHWQSVTGSREPGETLLETATRELREETGIDPAAWGGLDDWDETRVFEIYPKWRHRYPPGTTHNTEHIFALEVSAPMPITLAPDEHLNFAWIPWRDAAAKCFSWTNREAILALPQRVRERRRK